MTETDLKILRGDNDGLLTYEYLANHIGECGPEEINALIENMVRIDLSGQFMASAARYLHAIDPAGYAPAIRELVAGAIDKTASTAISPTCFLASTEKTIRNVPWSCAPPTTTSAVSTSVSSPLPLSDENTSHTHTGHSLGDIVHGMRQRIGCQCL